MCSGMGNRTLSGKVYFTITFHTGVFCRIVIIVHSHYVCDAEWRIYHAINGKGQETSRCQVSAYLRTLPDKVPETEGFPNIGSLNESGLQRLVAQRAPSLLAMPTKPSVS